MKSFLTALAFLCAAAAPAAAQLHENGVTRSGTVARTQTGGTAFMCRLACSLDSGCAGWNWVRAGEDGPQSRCEILTGEIAAAANACCASGLAEGGQAIVAASPSAAGNLYADRSRTPTGPPVSLVGDVPAGLLTEDLQLEELAEREGEDESDSEFAEEEEPEQGPQASTLAQEDVPTPSARINSVSRFARPGGRSSYSVQQEYSGADTIPEMTPPQPTGMQNPAPWTGG